ncbi:DNA-binding transcriptional regulator, MurR/RpiR family, contains HTH and SIS domains [Halolactibacillus halophilus]|uniref:DNA-binding transcriptional regulator, MurR/RpiR family, contains HTH and SIS domains n=1 Tax=Halolactibacillus halophilus TaxID=306540 RepID=A0A1I5NZV9_9BACI|nr:MurR/RpiR family transcriptional regulator [Halolactibacillus halophilus]GEM01556.1 putative HTH-type transcriptional regulator [Halolactibacillus halophilus]SFP27398.1 DNA-binding transcriptional regulator, MurR/RpiR family, contains HTH and SIS domains [Halolactibacillus halophilus]
MEYYSTLPASRRLDLFKNQFTKSELKLYDYILAHLDAVVYHSLSELSEQANVAEATSLRFFKKLQYSGFQAFKFDLAKEQPTHETKETDLYTRVKDGMLYSIETNHSLLDPRQLEHVAHLIDQKKDIVVFAIGASGIAGLDFQNQLMRVGKNIDVVTDTHTQIMRAANASPDTLLLTISLSGSTKSLIESTAIAKKKGAHIVSLTGFLKSPLTKVSDESILTHVKENPLERGTLSGKVAQLFVIDALCTTYIQLHKSAAKARREEITVFTADKLY